jgi:hypothetical protein
MTPGYAGAGTLARRRNAAEPVVQAGAEFRQAERFDRTIARTCRAGKRRSRTQRLQTTAGHESFQSQRRRGISRQDSSRRPVQVIDFLCQFRSVGWIVVPSSLQEVCPLNGSMRRMGVRTVSCWLLGRHDPRILHQHPRSPSPGSRLARPFCAHR